MAFCSYATPRASGAFGALALREGQGEETWCKKEAALFMSHPSLPPTFIPTHPILILPAGEDLTTVLG